MKKARVLLGAGLLAAIAWLCQWSLAPEKAGEAREGGSVTSEEISPTAVPESAAPTKARERDSAGEMAASSRRDELAATVPTADKPRVLLRPPALAPRAAESWRAGLAPRQPLAKEKLISPPGEVHRLTVKLADRLLARATPTGQLMVTATDGKEVAGLAAAADAWSLGFRPVQTISEEQLADLEMRAALRSGNAQPDLGGFVEAVVVDPTPERVMELATLLNVLPEVEFVEITSVDRLPEPPASDVPPTSSLLTSNQAYRDSLQGIDVAYAWNKHNAKGHASLKITDCEYAYKPNHEDLSGLVTLQPGVVTMDTFDGTDHGTAVLGILGAADNAYGMTGSAPLCPLYFFAEQATMSGGATQSRSACVTAALANSAVGDLVMLEMQVPGPTSKDVPAEYSASVWTAVKTGTDAGVIVIAAAGNGGEDLDGSAYASYRSRGDSGAIMVGAGSRTRERMSFSCYGTRVDVQGWGTTVASTGYGDLATYGSDQNQTYTAVFNGTSSATPIVTSAAALLQTLAIREQGTRLSPLQMRTLLRITGRPQTGNTSQKIGPLPNLAAAIPQLLGTPAPPVITDNVWGDGAYGQPFSFQIAATNSPTSYTVSSLPGGLSLNPATGLISGSPTEGGIFTLTVTASNAAGTGSGIVYFDILGNLGGAVEAPQLTWTSSTNARWLYQSTITKNAGDAAVSADIGDDGQSWMQTTVTGPGTLTFWWKVSSEAGFDFLRFTLDGAAHSAVAGISGNVDWQYKVVPIPAGSHTLRWNYLKDDSQSALNDAGYLDLVEYHPGVAANLLVTTWQDESNASLDPSLGSGISLREAITYGAAGAVIGFHPSLNDKTLALSLGQITVAKNFTIDASPLAAGLRINGGGSSRIFDIQSGRTVTIKNLHFRQGYDSGDGGGIRNSGTVSLSDCSFEGCSAGDDGGAIYNGGTLTLTRCTLTGNFADDAGGGILNAMSRTATLSECLLIRNIADDNGGAIASEGGGGASVSLTSCVLSHNQALGSLGGGAIDNGNNAGLTLNSCTLSSNTATFSGGAIDNEGTLTATACTFSNNGASTSLSETGGGGAIQHISGTLTATNCSFSGNSARYGGAIDGDNTSTIQLVSCTISGNHASSDGGGIEETDGTLNLTHCIVAGNTAGVSGPDIKGQVNTQTGGNLVSSTAGVTGFSGLVAAPQLSPLGIYGGTTATMPPLPGSPAINAGTSASALSTDQRGMTRTQGAAVDLGAVETGTPVPTVIVNTLVDENDGIGTGGISLRDAVAAATPGSTVAFAPGLAGGTVTLGNGELLLSKNVVIDGSAVPGGMVLRAGEGHRVLTLAPGKSALLKSLVITGGSESGNGGAVYNQGELVLDGCSVVDNYSEAYGAGIYNTGYLSLLGTTIARNEALESGGGIYSEDGGVTMSGCTVSDNEAWGGHGGGINSQATLTVKQCTFARNFAYCMGGAIDSSGPLILDSSTIADNLSGFGSIDNAHADGGGGGVNQHGATFSLNNTIIAGNTDESAIAKDLRGTITTLTGVNLLSSNQGVTGFSGLIAPPQLGPLASNGGPTLTMLPLAGSPALNSGGTTSYSTDQRGLPRVASGTVDIGAVEAGSSPPALVVNTAVDENNGTGVGGVSLRDAVNAAYPGATITFAPALDGTTIILSSQIYLGKHVSIDATALPNGVGVSGDGVARVFTVTAASSVSLRKLEIKGGSAGQGGGLLNAGDLSMSACEVIDCAADFGGGIYNAGAFEAMNCSLSNNAADDTGGAIYSQGRTLLMEDSTVKENGAANTAGGIYLQDRSSIIDRCSIYGNHAFGGHGGGLSNHGDLFLRSSTLANNYALCTGGGLDNYGDAEISSSTIAGNECGVAVPVHAHAQRGGGGVNNQSGAWVKIENCIVGNNEDGSGDAPDFRGQVNVQAGVNLFQSALGSTGFTGLTGNPLLDPLADNGGPTWTMVPQAVSPVIDAAFSSPYTVDQRGMPRVAGLAPDLGAVERPLVTLVVTNANDSGSGSLRDAVTTAPAGALITFAPALSRGTIHLSSGPMVLDRKLVIDATAVEHIELMGNQSFRVFSVSAGKRVLLRNLRVSFGGGTSGGGIYNQGDLTLDRCRLTDCNANEGGGIFNAAGADLEMLDCRVADCFANRGGGLRNEGGLVLTRSVFEKNGAAVNGGAVYDISGLTATRTVFLNNSSDGFAGALRSSGVVTLSDCTVDGNQAADSGGGLSLAGTAELNGCTISGNSCAGSGGGIVNSGGVLTLKNCTLTGNDAGADYGGAIYTAANLTVESCTISGNDAIFEGGGIYVEAGGLLALRNSIVADNEAEDSGPDIQGVVTSHAGVNLLGNSAGVSGSYGGFVGNPLLLPLGLYGGSTLTMPPAPGSPAINAGGSTLLTMDQRGLTRVLGGGLDIGAVEAGNTVPVIVVDTVTDEADGIEEGNVSLRDALRDAPAGATITFAPGLNAYPIGLTAGSSLKVEKNLIIDASALPSRMVITTVGDHSAIEVGPGLVVTLKGLVISGLNIDRDGALFNEGKLALENCRFADNTADSGGAVANVGDLTMTDCILQGNEATGQGGGLYNLNVANLVRCKLTANGSSTIGGGIFSNGALHLVDTTVSACGANASGGGLYNADEAMIERSTFSGNVAEAGDGGGIYNTGFLEVFSSTIAANLADGGGEGVGGGISNAGGDVFLRECTVSTNTAEGDGAGIWNSGSGDLGLRNTIVAGNTRQAVANDIHGTVNVSSGVNMVSTTAGISGAFTGLVAKPYLAPLGNYGGPTAVMPPLPGSPVINAATAGGGPSTDQCGRPRPVGPLPDIGAVEAVAFSSLGLADTDGDGIPDLLEPALGLLVGHNDAAADSDGDGVSDAAELADMTDPKNPNSYLRITSFQQSVVYNPVTNPVFTVQFPTFPGLRYRVEAEKSLQFSGGADLRQVVPSFTATGHSASVSVLLHPGKDFVRVVRE